jgi:4-amino-4-deoxy-L-arabinose transferase-like glycosyltransferase
MASAAGAARGDTPTRRATLVSWPWSLGGVVSIGLLFGLAHSLLRLAVSFNLPQDNVTSNILAQTLELGYSPRQPPLHEWLVWGVQLATGPTLISFLLIKYTLLAATLGFLYLAAKRLFDDPRWVALTALSPLLLYQIGWNLHEGVTQTMVLMCTVAASFWAFMRLVERDRVQDYLLFGVLVGLGLLTKYSFAGYLAALIAAAMLQAPLRAQLLDRRMVLAAVVAVLMSAPYFYWLETGQQDLVAVYGAAVAPHKGNRLTATLTGLGLAIYAPLAFLFPLDVILPLCFPRMVPEGWRSLQRAFSWNIRAQGKPDWEMLVLHLTLAGFVILAAGAILTGATHYLERYMHPFFLLTPLWLMTLAKRSERGPRQVKALITILFVGIVVVFGIRAYDLVRDMGPGCNKCRVAIPYEGLVAALKARGFQSGLIIADQRHDAGNLRRLLPAARVACLQRPSYVPPLRDSDRTGKLVLIWSPKTDGKQLPKGAEELIAQLGGKVDAAPEPVHVPWQPWSSSASPRNWDWMMLTIDLAKPSALSNGAGAGIAPVQP